MAKQTYTVGQTLTAAQMTSLQANDYNWTVSAKTANYVLVATDAGTTITMSSATATTITVNTSLFTAGDTLRIQNIGAAACVVTAGTATVTCAGSLSIPQWGGGTLYFTSASAAVYFPNAATGASSAFVLISSGSVSASAAITLDSIFTSTYRNYKVVLNGTCSADDADVTFRFRAGGATNSAASYTRIVTNNTPAGISRTNSTGQTSFTSFMATGITQITNETIIYAPQVAIATGIQWQSGTLSTNAYQYIGAGVFTNTTQFDGLVITPASGTITAQYRIYGLAD
jgi:hypothetical protein